MFSFTRDDRGILEPYGDMIAMVFVVIGFVFFFAIASQAYIAYRDKAFIAESYEDAVHLADNIKGNPYITWNDERGERSDLIDAEKLDRLDKNNKNYDEEYAGYFFKQYPKVKFSMKVETENEVWIIEQDGTSTKGFSTSVPVTVRMNAREYVPGILTVKIWRAGI
jgi:hypothetical protein